MKHTFQNVKTALFVKTKTKKAGLMAEIFILHEFNPKITSVLSLLIREDKVIRLLVVISL